MTASEDQGGDPPCWAHLFEPPDAIADAALVQLVHQLADALVVADADGTIIFWNQAAERLFGWTPTEAVGRTLDLIIPERLRQRHWDGYRTTMATGETRYGDRLLEVPADHRDGRTLSVAFTVTLLTRPGETRPFAIAALLRDDTARWQERRQLRAEVARLTPRVGEPAH